MCLFKVLKDLTGSQGTEFDPNNGQTWDQLFECSPKDMWGPGHTANDTRVIAGIDQKREGFHDHPRL